MKSMPSSALKEHSVRLTIMQMLIQKITKFGISFNSDGTTTFFAQLEKSSASQKEYLEKLQEKKAAEKKEAKKKEQSKQTEVRKNYGSGKFKRRTFG